MGNAIEKVLIFGSGYVATALTERLVEMNIPVVVTSRREDTLLYLESLGAEALSFGDPLPSVSHALETAPPEDFQDPVLSIYKDTLFPWSEEVTWFGYLSTTGVYGDTEGDVVTEKSPLNPITDRAKARMLAEMGYLNSGLPAHIFRLAGIYGPGRNALERLQDGALKKQPADSGPVNRIHVDDIVNVLIASMQNPNPGAIYNLADDEATPTKEVYRFAAESLGLEQNFAALPQTPPKEGGPMGDGTRVVSNEKVKSELNVTLKYPTYRQGLLPKI